MRRASLLIMLAKARCVKFIIMLMLAMLVYPSAAALDFAFDPKDYRTDIDNQRLLFVDLVSDGKFAAAEEAIRAGMLAVRADPEKINYFYVQMDSFSPDVAGLGRQINRWLQATPESANAHLVKAIWLVNKAWKIRGRKYVKDTKQSNLETFRLLISEAVKYVDNARDLSPENLLVPIYAIRTCITRGQECFAEQIDIIINRPFQERLSHWFMLNFLQAKWFGNEEVLNSYLAYLRDNGFFEKYPSLAPLQGTLLYYEATNSKGNRQKSLALLDKARKYGEVPGYLTSSIRMAYFVDDYRRVEELALLRDRLFPLNREVKEKNNYWAWVLRTKMINAYNADNFQESLDLATKLLAIYPLSEIALSYQGYASLQLGDKETYQNNFYLLVKKSPKEISYAITLDHAWLLDKRYDDVIAMWKHFLKTSPNYGRAHLEIAGTYKHKGSMEKAREHLKKSCDLGTKKACDILKRL